MKTLITFLSLLLIFVVFAILWIELIILRYVCFMMAAIFVTLIGGE